MSEAMSRYQRPVSADTSRASKGTALVTGASFGIGAIYADRLARRGHDLILVARNRERLEALATRLTGDTGRSVRIIVADLSDRKDLATVEHVLHTDTTVSMLVNNAGIGATLPLLDSDVDQLERMIDVNVTALMRVRTGHAVLRPCAMASHPERRSMTDVGRGATARAS